MHYIKNPFNSLRDERLILNNLAHKKTYRIIRIVWRNILYKVQVYGFIMLEYTCDILHIQ